MSIFTGIGGLEHPVASPLLICEQDEACQRVLRTSHPTVPIVPDVRSLRTPPRAGIVVGGWPCQDISAAGSLGGIRGERSGLFFEMLRVAKEAGAHTLIGENVPNLLTINKGADFRFVMEALTAEQYSYIGWRVLNARQFGLPQQRRRLFIVASRYLEHAQSIHSHVPLMEERKASPGVSAFYWTGGKRSLCFCRGYSPALKIGATDNNGRSPVAVLMGNQIRKLSALESLKLQGFADLDDRHFHLSRSTVLRMAGNAVPRPMGRFVVQAVAATAPPDGFRTGFGVVSESGLYENGLPWSISHAMSPLAANLGDFLDIESGDSLSSQAAAGLLVRSIRAQQRMPLELFDLLKALADRRNGTLRPSRANSFEALDRIANEAEQFRATLTSITDYVEAINEDFD